VNWTLELVPPGQDASDPRPGDFLLCHRKGLVSALIRLGERIRPGGDPRWSHAALIETPTTIIEALTRGTVRSPLSEYRQTEYAIVRTGLAGDDAAQAVAFARSCIGRRYGWLTIAAIVIRTLIPGRVLDGTEICSGEVAQALCRGWANFDQNPASMTPSVLASYASAETTVERAPGPGDTIPKGEALPTITQIRHYLTLTVLPVLAGAASNWLVVHLHFLAAFHVSSASVAGELTQLGVFGISAGLAFLASHHVLKGTYVAPLGALLPYAEPLVAQIGHVEPHPPVIVNVHPAPALVAEPVVAGPAGTTTAPPVAPPVSA
jgi:hypothetical protein